MYFSFVKISVIDSAEKEFGLLSLASGRVGVDGIGVGQDFNTKTIILY